MDIVLISTQDRSTDWDEHTIGSEIILGKRWNSKVMWVKWKLILVFFEIVLISTQDRCTVCPEHAIGSATVLGAPNGTPR
jgi:hypothetical protein